MILFILGFAFGFGLYFILKGLSLLWNIINKEMKAKAAKKRRLFEEHQAAMQALRILRGRIYVSTQNGKEHIISNYEEKVIEDALNGIYTIIGL